MQKINFYYWKNLKIPKVPSSAAESPTLKVLVVVAHDPDDHGLAGGLHHLAHPDVQQAVQLKKTKAGNCRILKST